MLNKESIIALLKEHEYPEFMFDTVFSKLSNLQPQIHEQFTNWMINKETPTIVMAGGFTFDILVNEFHQTPINAFLTLDWILREPSVATATLDGGIR